MPRTQPRKDLNLKSLELFQICARKGSLQATADETGLSVSTVSHHLRSLEDHLGVALFNHSRRPMALTPKGETFLRNIDGALLAIRKAKAEASAGNIAEASFLRVGTIEDLDSDITPEIAVYLSEQMPDCDFQYHTGSSHDLIDRLKDRRLDIGIVGTPPERLKDLSEFALLRDPFVIVVPSTFEASKPDIATGMGALPFLQFSSDLIIAQQIEAQLRRLGMTLPHKFACGNTQTLMAMVAAGAGWTITTPLMFSRARRFQPKLRMHPFPGARFARTLSLVATPDCSRAVLKLVDHKLRSSLKKRVLSPLHQSAPWLQDQFVLLD